MQLTENTLTFKVPNANAGEVYIDIARAMSIVNRKLFRQQGLWTVLGMKFYCETSPAGGGVTYQVAVSGAPRNWVTRNALVKAFEHWKEQQAEAYAASSPSIKPRWQDFKVYLSENHRATGDLTPISGHMFGGTDTYQEGEWVHSSIVYTDLDGGGLPDTHEVCMHILDTGNVCVGLIRQYQISRARVISPDPDVPGALTTSIYTLMDAGLSDKIAEVTENLLDQNDEPPYDVENYPGGSSNGTEPLLYGYVSNSSNLKRSTGISGFSVPNGLLEVQFQAGEPSDFWITMVVQGRSQY